MRRRNTVLRALVLTCCVAVLPGCTLSMQDCPPEAIADLAGESAGLSLPRPLPLDLSLVDVEAVAAHYEGPVRFVADVLRGDWPRARAYWTGLATIDDSAERMRQIYRLHFLLQGRGLYFLHVAEEWVHAEPAEPAARLLLGVVLADAATQARGQSFAHEVDGAQMALFRHRFERARVHLEAVASRGDVLSSLAHASLQLPWFYLGESDKGWNNIEALIGQAPQYGWLYFWATEYAQPRWAGRERPQRLRRLTELADQNALNALDRKVLDQELAYVEHDLYDQPNPQAWRPYWQQRHAEAPHLYNLLRWLTHEHQVQNWPAIERLATEALALNPHQTYSLHLRSMARKETGRAPEALRDTIAATVLGNDAAMHSLVYAHLHGTMGVVPGDHGRLVAYCKIGAAFGLPAAANCLGSMYVDGAGGLARDPALGVGWHLLAARGGNLNSQHDLGVLLPQTAVGERGQRLANYWLREAARRGHTYAQNKLGLASANGRPLHPACEPAPVWGRLAQTLHELLLRR